MHVADAHVEPSRLRLSGRHAVLEVSCPLPGVLRLRHAPVSSESGFLHPELPGKRSWSVVAEASRALTVERDGDHVRVTAEGASLEVDAESGTWRFRDAQGRELARCVDVSGEVQAAYPMSRHRARLALRALPGERYLGFGEKVGPLDTVPVWLRAGGAVALTRPAMHTTDANWKHLAWHVHAAPEVHGRLYEDARDGYGESRLTVLRGGVTDGVLRLERSETGVLPRVRTAEMIRVNGLRSVRQVTGALAHRFENGVLELQVAADWTRLDVEP